MKIIEGVKKIGENAKEKFTETVKSTKNAVKSQEGKEFLNTTGIVFVGIGFILLVTSIFSGSDD